MRASSPATQLLASLGLCALGASSSASAAELEHHAGLVSGVALHQSPKQLVVGFGGGLWYSVRAEQLSLQVSFQPMVFSAPGVSTSWSGSWVARPEHLWRPELGVQLGAWFGGKLRILSDVEPSVVGRGPALSAQVVLRPLSFDIDGYQVSFLEIGVGRGLESLADSTVVSATVMRIGLGF